MTHPAYRPLLLHDGVGWQQQFVANACVVETTPEASTIHLGELIDGVKPIHYLRLEWMHEEGERSLQVELNDQGNQRGADDIGEIALGESHLRITYFGGPWSGRVSYSPSAEILTDEPWDEARLETVVVWLDGVAEHRAAIEDVIRTMSPLHEEMSISLTDEPPERVTAASSMNPSDAPPMLRNRTRLPMPSYDAEEIARTRAALRVGAELEGTVLALAPYGAFVDLGGVEGLLHRLEMPADPSPRSEQKIDVGQEVRVIVIKVSPDGFTYLSCKE